VAVDYTYAPDPSESTTCDQLRSHRIEMFAFILSRLTILLSDAFTRK